MRRSIVLALLLVLPMASGHGLHAEVDTAEPSTPAEARASVQVDYPLPPDPADRFDGFVHRENITTKGDLAGALRVLRFAHVTDMQLVDDDAPFPMRQGLLDDVYGPTISGGGERPQEEYSDEILHSMIDVLNEHHAIDPFDFAVHTGDNIDNALENELMRYIDIVDGGHTTTGPISGFACLPDGQSEDVDDHTHDQTLTCTSIPDDLVGQTRGLADDLPWYSAYGNHDGLIQGNVNIAPGFQELANQFGRYFIREHEYIAMHFADLDPCAGGGDADDNGHGFGMAGLRLCDADPDNDGYYAFDQRGLRFIVLDTVNDEVAQTHQEYGPTIPSERTTGYDFASGLSEGAIDANQFAWLQQELNASRDQAVAIMAHHTIRAFYNDQFDPACGPPGCANQALADAGLIGRSQMEALLTSHPNVVAFVGGHTHEHRVTPRTVENTTSPGYWNIETSGLLDLPQESRIVELWITADGTKAFWALDPIGHTFGLAKDLAAQDDDHNATLAAGSDLDRRTLLWFDVPDGATVATGHQPERAKTPSSGMQVSVQDATDGVLAFDAPGRKTISATVTQDGQEVSDLIVRLDVITFHGNTTTTIDAPAVLMRGTPYSAPWTFDAPGQYDAVVRVEGAEPVVHKFTVDVLLPDGSSVESSGEGPTGVPPTEEDEQTPGPAVVAIIFLVGLFGCPPPMIEAWAAPEARAPLEPFQYPSDVGAHEVRLDVSHCGICHSDVHLVDDDWGVSRYPLVPGHEAVGTVAETGSAVEGLEPGMRVGVGWQCGACHACDHCIRGQHNLCRANRATAVGHHGAFGDGVVVDARLAFPIPDTLSSAGAAPLLCGGVTVYAPLARFARPGDHVGVIGIGGLGHLAVRFAAAMGCRVTAYTHSPDKTDEILAMGAHEVVTDDQSPRQDLIINTVYADLDWNAYLRALRPDGTLCFVGVPPSPLSIHAGELLGGQKRVTGSAIGGAAAIRDMLAFAALHGIEATVEEHPLAACNEALQRTREGKARYRAVLTV